MTGIILNEYLLRERILALLWDEEMSRVALQETKLKLAEGDQFVDLEDLELGVQLADGIPLHMGTVLPRKTVKETTWQQICALLASPPIARELAARASAERASRQAEKIVAIVAHDLRNPLNSIASGAWLIHKRSTDVEVQRIAEHLQTAAGRMSRLISELLDFSRVRAGVGLSLRPTPMNLATLVTRVRDELSLSGGNITIHAEGEATGLWDEDRLAQVFSNLLGNALEHSTEGSRAAVIVDGRSAELVDVLVHNPGVIPADFLPEIFEPFRKGNTRASEGLGLGLYTSKALVTAHGGTIDVTSSQDDGTFFRVLLPRRCPSPDALLPARDVRGHEPTLVGSPDGG